MLHVRVTPRASANAVTGFDDSGVLHVRVTAAPADGAANRAAGQLLAKALGLPPRDLVLVRGATARQKSFDVPLTESQIAARLTAPG